MSFHPWIYAVKNRTMDATSIQVLLAKNEFNINPALCAIRLGCHITQLRDVSLICEESSLGLNLTVIEQPEEINVSVGTMTLAVVRWPARNKTGGHVYSHPPWCGLYGLSYKGHGAGKALNSVGDRRLSLNYQAELKEAWGATSRNFDLIDFEDRIDRFLLGGG